MKLVTTVTKIPQDQMDKYREWVETHGGEILLPIPIKKITAPPKEEMELAWNGKPKAIYTGFSNHDCAAYYKCPLCKKIFNSYMLKKDDDRCPCCGEELYF